MSTDTETIVIQAADTIAARLPHTDDENIPRGFSVADHLDDRDKAALLELAKHVI